MSEQAPGLQLRELMADRRGSPHELGVGGERLRRDRLAGRGVALRDLAEDRLLAGGEHLIRFYEASDADLGDGAPHDRLSLLRHGHCDRDEAPSPSPALDAIVISCSGTAAPRNCTERLRRLAGPPNASVCARAISDIV